MGFLPWMLACAVGIAVWDAASSVVKFRRYGAMVIHYSEAPAVIREMQYCRRHPWYASMVTQLETGIFCHPAKAFLGRWFIHFPAGVLVNLVNPLHHIGRIVWYLVAAGLWYPQSVIFEIFG